MTGQRFGAYRVLREIGRGGMGIVYLAEHETGGTQVAVKTLRVLDPRVVASMQREVVAPPASTIPPS
ncbi:MAG: hypothetical protein U0166_00090 [Acidobacteriota bacterium]